MLLVLFADEKYGYLDGRAGYAPPSTMIESSFKHYPETSSLAGGGIGGGGGLQVAASLQGQGMMDGNGGGPELINMTSTAGLPPAVSGSMTTTGVGTSAVLTDDVVDVTLQPRGGMTSSAIATMNNGGALATLPRSSLANRHSGTGSNF